MNCDIRDKLIEGETKVYGIGNVDYEVSSKGIDGEGRTAKFGVNGEYTEALGIGSSYKLADGTILTVEFIHSRVDENDQDNVAICLASPQVLMPDLVVGRIRFDPEQPKEGDPVFVKVEVANKGSAPASGFTVEFSEVIGRLQQAQGIAETMEMKKELINYLGVGETTTFTYGPYRFAPGNHEFVAIVDPYNNVEELDERNNKAYVGLTVVDQDDDRVIRVYLGDKFKLREGFTAELINYKDMAITLLRIGDDLCSIPANSNQQQRCEQGRAYVRAEMPSGQTTTGTEFYIQIGETAEIFDVELKYIDGDYDSGYFVVNQGVTVKENLEVYLHPTEQRVEAGDKALFRYTIKDTRPMMKCLSGSSQVKCMQPVIEYSVNVEGLPFRTLYEDTVRLSPGEKKEFELIVYTDSQARVNEKYGFEVSVRNRENPDMLVEVGGMLSVVSSVIPRPVADFRNYPEFLVENNRLNGVIVVGDRAPAEDVVAAVDIATGLQYESSESIGRSVTISKIEVGATKLASEIRDPEAQNLILVGRPTRYAGGMANKLIDNFEEELSEIPGGQSRLQIVRNGRNIAVIVTGRDQNGPRNAARVLANYEDYDLSGKEMCIEREGNTFKVYKCKGIVEPPRPPEFPSEKAKLKLYKGWNLVSLPGPLVRFDSNDCIGNKKLLGFVYLKDEQRYVSLTEARKVLGNNLGKYLAENAFWIYSYEDCVLVMSVEKSFRHNPYLAQGWNLVPVSDTLYGLSLNDVSGRECNLEKTYLWNSMGQEWIKIDMDYRFSEDDRGFIAKSDSNCMLNLYPMIIESTAMPLPAFPE